MKKLFIVANWKSNKTKQEAHDWLQEFFNLKPQVSGEKEVIICPPYLVLPFFKQWIDKQSLSLGLGAQDVSPFDKGAYTGEVNATQVKDFATYTIIGHSERRSNFGETNEMLAKKVEQALSAGMQPIFCIQNTQTPIPEGVTLVAYEPIEAIGTGHPDTPEKANAVAEAVKQQHSNVKAVLYGGSVTPEDVNGFTQSAAIDGVLVGGASLDPQKFAQLIQNS